MMPNNFDPYDMMMDLQNQISALQGNQNHLMSVIRQNREVIQALHNSNQKNFEFMLEQAGRLDALLAIITKEQQDNTKNQG